MNPQEIELNRSPGSLEKQQGQSGADPLRRTVKLYLSPDEDWGKCVAIASDVWKNCVGSAASELYDCATSAGVDWDACILSAGCRLDDCATSAGSDWTNCVASSVDKSDYWSVRS